MAVTEFTSEQFASAYPDGIERHYWHAARNDAIAHLLDRTHLRGKRMLEVGCGRGIVLRALRDAGFACRGVELADVPVPPDLAELMHSGCGFEELDRLLAAPVEVVLLLDVIEHIEHPELFLARIRQAFPALTHLVVTVPARQELWSNYDEHYGHFLRYSISALHAVTRAAGFRPVHTTYAFHSLYLPAFALARVGIARRVTLAPPRAPWHLLHRALAWYFRLEQALTPARIAGTSILSVLTVDTGA